MLGSADKRVRSNARRKRRGMPDLPQDARARLKSVFGYDDFRPGQAEIIAAVLAGEPVLAVMPTGSGKSMCYQLPAVLDGSLTVVVSPLIALMRDQVQQMRLLGVAAATLNSQNDAAENAQTRRALRDGELRLLFVSPERLLMDVGSTSCAARGSPASRSTRRIASPNGAMIFAPNIASWAARRGCSAACR